MGFTRTIKTQNKTELIRGINVPYLISKTSGIRSIFMPPKILVVDDEPDIL